MPTSILWQCMPQMPARAVANTTRRKRCRNCLLALWATDVNTSIRYMTPPAVRVRCCWNLPRFSARTMWRKVSSVRSWISPPTTCAASICFCTTSIMPISTFAMATHCSNPITGTRSHSMPSCQIRLTPPSGWAPTMPCSSTMPVLLLPVCLLPRAKAIWRLRCTCFRGSRPKALQPL